MRKLAERSAKATREIADLIKGIQFETERAIASTKDGNLAIQEGLKRAKGAGDALIEIVKSSTHASQLIDQIATATQEQSNSSNLILNAAEAMNQLTQRVSEATKEQAAGSALIIKAVYRMNIMTRQVSVATAEQKHGGDQMVRGIEHTSRGAKAAEKAAAEFSQAAIGLQAMSRTLLDIVDFWGQTGETRDSAGPGLGSGDKSLIGDGRERLLITQGEATNGR